MTDRLILQGSISFARYPDFWLRLGSHIGLRPLTQKYVWRLIHSYARRNPKAAIKALVGSLTTLNPSVVVAGFSKQQTHKIEELIATMSSDSGFLNDIRTIKNDATDIAVPTLIIHSKYDKGVSPRHAQLLAKQIKGSILLLSAAESHLIWFSPHYPEIEKAMDEFIDRAHS